MIPFDPYMVVWDTNQLLYILIYYVLLAVPFFISGLIIGLVIARIPKRISEVYFYNMLGSGLGSVALVLMAFYLPVEDLIVLTSVIALLASLVFAFHEKKGQKTIFLAVSLTLVLLIIIQTSLEVRISPYKSLNILLNYPDAKISVLFGIGDGSFGEPVTTEGTYGMHGFVVADLDGDAYPDLAWVNSAGLVSVLINKGDGTFQERFDYHAGGEIFNIVAVDMDGNASLDLVVAPTGSGMASLLTNNGDGTFELTQDYYFKGAWVSLFVVSDVDGDGNPDLVGWDDTSVYVFPLEDSD